MKGYIFDNLPALQMVYLNGNECIDRIFGVENESNGQFIKGLFEDIRELSSQLSTKLVELIEQTLKRPARKFLSAHAITAVMNMCATLLSLVP